MLRLIIVEEANQEINIAPKKTVLPQISRRGFLQFKFFPARENGTRKQPAVEKASSSIGIDTKLTRRKFLAVGGATVLSAAAAAQNMGIKPWEWFNVNRASGGQLAVPDIPAQIPATDKEDIKNQAHLQNGKEAVEQAVAKENPSFEMIFGDLSPAEKADAQRRVDEQIKNYQNAYRQNPEGLKKRIADSQKWQPIIEKAAKNLGFKPDSFVPPALSSLIFVESEGDPGKISYQGGREVAYGLCQLKLDVAKAAARNLGIGQIKKSDLFNPELNIKLSLQTLHRLYQLFPERSLAFWAYHLGETNLARALGSYTESIVNRPEDIDKILNSEERIGTARLIKGFKNDENQEANFIRLVNSPIATGQLKEDGALGDDTQFYVPRIVAAGTLMER